VLPWRIWPCVYWNKAGSSSWQTPPGFDCSEQTPRPLLYDLDAAIPNIHNVVANIWCEWTIRLGYNQRRTATHVCDVLQSLRQLAKSDAMGRMTTAGNSLGIIDGTPHYIRRPWRGNLQRLHYAGHRHSHVMSSQCIVDADNYIIRCRPGFIGTTDYAVQVGLFNFLDTVNWSLSPYPKSKSIQSRFL
jgi:hypothetical protein